MLEEIGLNYKVTKIDLSRGDQFKTEFVKISPFSKIPAIVDHDNNNVTIFESGAILIYLAEKSGRFYNKKDKLSIDPNVDNGMMTKVWGPPGWLFLHCVSFGYPYAINPQNPAHKNKKLHYGEFFNYVGTVYPDGLEITELLRRTVSGNTAVFEFKDEGRMSIRGKDLPYKNRVAISLDFENGKIKHYREYFGSDGKSN